MLFYNLEFCVHFHYLYLYCCAQLFEYRQKLGELVTKRLGMSVYERCLDGVSRSQALLDALRSPRLTCASLLVSSASTASLRRLGPSPSRSRHRRGAGAHSTRSDSESSTELVERTYGKRASARRAGARALRASSTALGIDHEFATLFKRLERTHCILLVRVFITTVSYSYSYKYSAARFCNSLHSRYYSRHRESLSKIISRLLNSTRFARSRFSQSRGKLQRHYQTSSTIFDTGFVE